jgi:hypothetical protein
MENKKKWKILEYWMLDAVWNTICWHCCEPKGTTAIEGILKSCWKKKDRHSSGRHEQSSPRSMTVEGFGRKFIPWASKL